MAQVKVEPAHSAVVRAHDKVVSGRVHCDTGVDLCATDQFLVGALRVKKVPAIGGYIYRYFYV